MCSSLFNFSLVFFSVFQMPKKCCIIGAGVAGLTSIKHCLEVDIEPTCFEKDEDIGGLWNYHDEAKDGFPSLYKSCRINTSKEMTCFSDFPIPKEFPNFMHHTDFKRYLDMYADWFKLRKYTKFKVCKDSLLSIDNLRPIYTSDLWQKQTTKKKQYE